MPMPMRTAMPLPTSTASEGPVPTGYTVKIARGLQVLWTPSAAALTTIRGIMWNEKILGRELAEPRIISIEAMAGKDVPDAFSGPWPEVPVAWVVHAQGTYFHPLPGQPPLLGTDGFIVYDDAGNPIGGGTFNSVPFPTD